MRLGSFALKSISILCTILAPPLKEHGMIIRKCLLNEYRLVIHFKKQFSVSFYAGCSTRLRNTISLLPRMMSLEMTLTFSGYNLFTCLSITDFIYSGVERKALIILGYICYRDIKFNYCILDEGHVIKNGKTKLSKAIKQLTANYRIILSGTPIQVRTELLSGLYTLLFKSLWSFFFYLFFLFLCF